MSAPSPATDTPPENTKLKGLDALPGAREGINVLIACGLGFLADIYGTWSDRNVIFLMIAALVGGFGVFRWTPPKPRPLTLSAREKREQNHRQLLSGAIEAIAAIRDANLGIPDPDLTQAMDELTDSLEILVARASEEPERMQEMIEAFAVFAPGARRASEDFLAIHSRYNGNPPEDAAERFEQTIEAVTEALRERIASFDQAKVQDLGIRLAVLRKRAGASGS